MTALPVMLPSIFLLSLLILICKFRDLVRGIILCVSAKPNILIWVGDIPNFFWECPIIWTHDPLWPSPPILHIYPQVCKETTQLCPLPYTLTWYRGTGPTRRIVSSSLIVHRLAIFQWQSANFCECSWLRTHLETWQLWRVTQLDTTSEVWQVCLCEGPIFQHRSCIKSIIIVSKWKIMSFASLSADSSETAQRCRQIHCWPLQSIFRNPPEMRTNSLLTSAVNLQKLPRDVHKSITNHHNQSSETAQRCTQIHYQSLQSIFRNSSLCLRLSLTQPSALCCSLQSDCQLAKCFSFQPQNVICKRSWNSALAQVEEENATNHFCPFIAPFYNTCTHSTCKKMQWNQSCLTPLLVIKLFCWSL